MSKKTLPMAKVPDPIRRVVEELGVNLTVLNGGRHWRLMVNGRQVGVLGKGSRAHDRDPGNASTIVRAIRAAAL